MTKELKWLSLLVLTVMTATAVSACSNVNEAKKSTSAKVEVPSVQSVVTSGHVMTEQQVKEDFEAFMKIIEENYPFLGVNKRLNGVDFLANKEVYWKRVKDSKTAEALQANLSLIMDELNNGHAHIIDKRYRDRIYIGASDIVKNDNSYAEMLKPELTMLENPASIKFYGALPGVGLNKTGANVQGEVRYSNVLTSQLCDGDLAYLRIDSFNRLNEDYDREQIMTFYKVNAEAKALVIDIRKNGGGSDLYWKRLIAEPLLKQKSVSDHFLFLKSGENNKRFLDALKTDKTIAFHKVSDLSKKDLPRAHEEAFKDFDIYIKDEQEITPSNSVGFKGKVYVLISPYVFSASEDFSVFCKESGFATLVGQRTGGDGIGRSPMLFCLPNSGILGRYPAYYGMNAQGVLNEEFKTEPDYPVDYKFESTELSKDPCIQTIIQLEHLNDFRR